VIAALATENFWDILSVVGFAANLVNPDNPVHPVKLTFGHGHDDHFYRIDTMSIVYLI
jgi:hypothetical protein